MEKQQFSHLDKSTLIRTKQEWLNLTSEKICFFYLPPFHYLFCSPRLQNNSFSRDSGEFSLPPESFSNRRKGVMLRIMFKRKDNFTGNASHGHKSFTKHVEIHTLLESLFYCNNNGTPNCNFFLRKIVKCSKKHCIRCKYIIIVVTSFKNTKKVKL